MSSLLDYLKSAAIRHPVIGQAHFRDILSFNGIPVTIQKRAAPSDIDCSCQDPIFHRPDPDCILCKGSGIRLGWTKRLSRAILVERDPHMSDGAGRILTTGGEIERSDIQAYFLPYTDVNDEDIVILSRELGKSIEYLVKNKVIRFGTRQQPVYIRCELWKTPVKEVITSARV